LNATSDSPGPGASWRYGLFLFVAVVALSAPQAAILPLIDRDEPHFAEASREMLQSGNFIVPTFNHAPRYNKPPLIYWCQAVSFTLFGENAFAARLPSLLATAGTAVLLLAWGVEFSGVCVGMIAGLAYAFCLQTVQQGRVATADALLIFFMTLTAFAGWKLIVHPPASRGARTYFWDTFLALGFAGGFLAKGPEALLPLLPLLFSARSVRRGAVPELIVNFLLGLLIVLFWAIPAWIMTQGDYWRAGLSEGIGQRAVTGLQGHGPSTFRWYFASLLFYLLLFWISALPWSPLLVTHRKKLFAGWKPDPTDVFLILNAGLIFLIFSLMVTKLPHYTLPAFPFIALLLARRWTSAGLLPGLPTKLALGMGVGLALLIAVLAPMGLAQGFSPSPVGSLVRQAEGAITPETAFALVDFQEPNAVWEMRRVTKAYAESISEAGALDYLNQPGPRAMVLSTSLWERIKPASDNANPSWTIYQARGWNTARGWNSAKGTLALVDLTLVVKK